MKKHKIEPQPKTARVSEQFARSSGTVAMTENASSISEQTRKAVNNLDRSCTTKIK
jgi:enamine deaminase RidA (YjgF/YER057c/UK114 family)